MKIAPKITFLPSRNGIIRVLYKNVYIGRIAHKQNYYFEDDQDTAKWRMEYEWQEKGWRVFAAHCQNFSSVDLKVTKDYATDRLLTYEKNNKRMLDVEFNSLTELGIEFFRKFHKNHVQYNKNLSTEHQSVANYFVRKGLLEKGTLNKDVVFFTETPVNEIMSKYYENKRRT